MKKPSSWIYPEFEEGVTEICEISINRCAIIVGRPYVFCEKNSQYFSVYHLSFGCLLGIQKAVDVFSGNFGLTI